MPAKADYGERAIRIECLPSQDSFTVEPFIIWNEEYRHNGVDLSGLRHHKKIVIGNATYVWDEGHFPDAHAQCRTRTRTITLSLERAHLQIAEKTRQGTRYVHAELMDHIGSAWQVWGPTYRMTSITPGVWQDCRGRQDEVQQKTVCIDRAMAPVPLDPLHSDDEDWAR